MGVKHCKEFTFPAEFGFTGSAGKSNVSAHMRSKPTPMKAGGKSMKPGGGGRFAKLKGELAHRPGVTNPGALAAFIGRKKYGAHKMGQFSAKGRARMKVGGQVDAGEFKEREPDEVAPGKPDQYRHGGHVKPGGRHHFKEGGQVDAGEYAETTPDLVAPGREDQFKRGGHVKAGGKHHYAKGGMTKGPEKSEHEGQFEDFKRGGKAMRRGGKC